MKILSSTTVSQSLMAVLIVLALTLALQTPVFAAESGIDQQQAAQIAQQAHPGRVLGVRQRGEVYKVKILNAQGEVRVIVIDANSGKIVSGR